MDPRGNRNDERSWANSWIGNAARRCRNQIKKAAKKIVIFVGDNQFGVFLGLSLSVSTFAAFAGAVELLSYWKVDEIYVGILAFFAAGVFDGLMLFLYPVINWLAKFVDDWSSSKARYYGLYYGYKPRIVGGFFHCLVSMGLLGLTCYCGVAIPASTWNEFLFSMLSVSNVLMSFAWNSEDDLSISSSLVSIPLGGMISGVVKDHDRVTVWRVVGGVLVLCSPYLRFLVLHIGSRAYVWATYDPSRLRRTRSLNELRGYTRGQLAMLNFPAGQGQGHNQEQQPDPAHQGHDQGQQPDPAQQVNVHDDELQQPDPADPGRQVNAHDELQQPDPADPGRQEIAHDAELQLLDHADPVHQGIPDHAT